MTIHRAAIVIVLLVALSACTPGLRRPASLSESAKAAIAEFAAAAVALRQADKESWNTPVTFGTPPITVHVVGRAPLSHSIRVVYPDAAEAAEAIPRRDYTNVIDIRVKDSTLYVYRVVTLLSTEYRLAVFDLTKRRRIADHLVSPEDMPLRTP